MHHIKPHYPLLLLAVVAASQTVLGKFALERMPVYGYMFLRFALAYLLILIALRATGRQIPWKKILPFAPLAVLWVTNGFIFILGLSRTNATTAQFIHASIPIITAIFAGLILRHRLSKSQWVGVSIAFVGVVIIITSKGSLSLSNFSFVGNVLVFASAIGFALYAVLTRLVKFRNIDPFEMVFIGSTFAIPFVLPFAWAEYVQVGNWLPQVSPIAWAALLLASVAMVCFATVFQMLINKIGPSYASLNQYLNPVFVIFWAALILNEKPQAQALIGAAVALAGVSLVTWRQRRDDLEASVRASSIAE